MRSRGQEDRERARKRCVGSAVGKVAVCEQDGVLTRAGHKDDAAAAGARVLRLLARRLGELLRWSAGKSGNAAPPAREESLWCRADSRVAGTKFRAAGT